MTLAIAGFVGNANAQPPAAADAATAPAGETCGRALSAAAIAEWENFGGRDGRLGCPTADETDTVPSPAGVRSRLVAFGDAGGIVLPTSGTNAGLAFAVSGCAWTLWFQYGGAGGWLGLPLEEAQNTPDGQTQKFEGGTIAFTRALATCDATPSGQSRDSR